MDGALNDLQLEIAASADANGGNAKINVFSARSGSAQLALQPGASVTVDPKNLTLAPSAIRGNVHRKSSRRFENPISRGLLRELSPEGTINFNADLSGPLLSSVPWPDSVGQLQVVTKDFSLLPAGAAAPIAISTGPIRLVGNVLSVRDIKLRSYGGDAVLHYFRRALPVLPLSQGIIKLNEINASLSLHAGGFAYPWPLTDFFTQCQPAGHFALSGSGSADFSGDQPAFDYDILLSGDNGLQSPHRADPHHADQIRRGT